jgi:hypothetical protein
MINYTTFSGIADRVAYEVDLLKTAINNGFTVGTPFYPRVHIGAGTYGDYSLENDLISSARSIDTSTISGTMLKNIYQTFISALETHTLNNGAVSFNSWLDISGINVHPSFDDAWYASKGTHLDAVNVFNSNDNVLVARYDATGSGTGTYYSVTPIGTGTGAVSATNHAASKLVLVPVCDTTADAQINLRLLREAGQSSGSTADSANIVIPSGTLSGTQFEVNATNAYLDCNNIVGAGSTSGNTFRVYALLERGISL